MQYGKRINLTGFKQKPGVCGCMDWQHLATVVKQIQHLIMKSFQVYLYIYKVD